MVFSWRIKPVSGLSLKLMDLITGILIPWEILCREPMPQMVLWWRKVVQHKDCVRFLRAVRLVGIFTLSMVPHRQGQA
ncbi:hypothetical protein D3C86_2185650 [compost metagenome]